jgi:menaquinone-dependent protoporphyrinogen oxidase
MANILLVYATRHGQTEKIARRLASVLTSHGHSADLFDADHSVEADLRAYGAIVVGAPIHASGYPRSILRFVREHREFLQRVPSAFFSVGLAVASRTHDGRKQTLPIVERFIADSGWRPARIELIAGALAYSKYGLLTRFVMRRIAAREGGDTDTSRDYEYTDWDAVDGFASSLAADAYSDTPPAEPMPDDTPPVGHSPLVRLAALLVASAALLGVLLGAVRPWYTTWGATPEEYHAELPGDWLTPGAARETRAISIAAPADRVFAWVAQLGQDRAGFYSYELLEDLAGCEMPRIEQLDPELQRWNVGDKLWLYPPEKADGAGHATLLEYQPGRSLVFGTHDPADGPGAAPSGTWSLTAEPTGEATSRLIVRGSGTPPPGLLGAAFNRAVFEPMHFAMERRMMEGIRGLAEGHPPTRLADNAMLGLWTLTFGVFAASALLVVFGRRWQRHLAGFLAAGIVFQALTLGQPPLWLGSTLVLGLLLLNWAPSEDRVRAPGESGVSALQSASDDGR